MTAEKTHCAGEPVPALDGRFITLCGCYAGDCPQVGLSEDGTAVEFRTSQRKDRVVSMDPGEWGEFLTSVGATHDPLGKTAGLRHGRADL
jgi:hypothetical protein